MWYVLHRNGRFSFPNPFVHDPCVIRNGVHVHESRRKLFYYYYCCCVGDDDDNDATFTTSSPPGSSSRFGEMSASETNSFTISSMCDVARHTQHSISCARTTTTKHSADRESTSRSIFLGSQFPHCVRIARMIFCAHFSGMDCVRHWSGSRQYVYFTF